MRALIDGASGPCLLLGVTPELAVIRHPLVAIDWSAEMIAQVWPGNEAGRTVVRADWLDMPFAPGSFAAALGDGVVNMLPWPDSYYALAARLKEAVRPGGRIVLRCFTAPETPDALGALASELLNGSSSGFHAFKWRLAMASAQGKPNLTMRHAWVAFERHFPDRERLSAATGWSLATIAEIDDYRASPMQKSFPTSTQLLQAFPGARLTHSGEYELSERCPLLVIDI